MNVPTNKFLQSLATAAIAASGAGPLNGAKMGLFTNTPPLDQTTVLADLTQPTFAGYALQAVTWSPVFQQPDGSWVNQGASLLWQMSDDLVPTIVTGIFLTNAGASFLWVAEVLDVPINLATSAQAFLASAQVAYGQTGWGTNGIIL